MLVRRIGVYSGRIRWIVLKPKSNAYLHINRGNTRELLHSPEDGAAIRQSCDDNNDNESD